MRNTIPIGNDDNNPSSTIRISPDITLSPSSSPAPPLVASDGSVSREYSAIIARYYIKTAEELAACSIRNRRKYVYIVRIEETDDREDVDPCARCKNYGYTCRKYKESAIPKLTVGRLQAGTACSRCRVVGTLCKQPPSSPVISLARDPRLD
jgi:hypothetical protein